MIDSAQIVAEIAASEPRSIAVFERFGVDYCCHGQRPLDEACEAAGVPLGEITAALESALEAQRGPVDRDWQAAPLGELIDHILSTYHAALRRDLPELGRLAEKVRSAHAANHPEVVPLAGVFAGLRAELESHMMKEEQVLFPFVKELEAASSGESGSVTAPCGSVQGPIQVMEHEHDDAAQALASLRQLTNGYTPPDDACASFQGLLSGLAHLERDLHHHIHLENNILFPRSAALEATAGRAW